LKSTLVVEKISYCCCDAFGRERNWRLCRPGFVGRSSDFFGACRLLLGLLLAKAGCLLQVAGGSFSLLMAVSDVSCSTALALGG